MIGASAPTPKDPEAGKLAAHGRSAEQGGATQVAQRPATRLRTAGIAANDALAPLLARSVQARASGAAGVPWPTPATPTLLRWESFEHLDLGDTAAGGPAKLITLTCHDTDFPERADRARWPEKWRKRLKGATAAQIRVATKGLTYGEILALSGDAYGAFTDRTGKARSTFEALDIAPLSEIVELIPLMHGKHTTSAQLEDATGGRYMRLAKLNIPHFSSVPVGQRNVDVWRAMHRDAIMLAMQARTDPRFENRAWGLNAASDHFLTDAFSAGHMRTPRAALLAQGDLGNFESKILHDLDNTFGVEVTNRRGDKSWIAYGDDHLDAPENAKNRAYVREAVELSKQDIANAVVQGTAFAMPQRFAAEQVVPVPVDMAKDRWSGRVPTYVTTPDGTSVRQADDYTQMRSRIVAAEGGDIAAGTYTDDNRVRDWVTRVDAAALARQPVTDKQRLIDILLSGVTREGDVAAIEKIGASATAPGELAELRKPFVKRTGSLKTTSQRRRVRVALGIGPTAMDGDSETREWTMNTDPAVLGSYPVADKIHMIKILLGGWISDDDVAAIERICASSPSDLADLRKSFEAGTADISNDTQRRRVRIALGCGPSVLKDDNEVREWVANVDARVIGRYPVAGKTRMIRLLLAGWISDDDVAATEKVCAAVPSAEEMAQLRKELQPQVSSMSKGQGRRVRAALSRL